MSADQIFFLTGITKFLLIKCNKACSNLFTVLINKHNLTNLALRSDHSSGRWRETASPYCCKFGLAAQSYT